MSEQFEKEKVSSKWFFIAIAVFTTAIAIIAIFVFVISGPSRKLRTLIGDGQRYLSELNYEQAIAAYEEAISIAPRKIDGYTGLSDVYIAMANECESAGDIETAISYYEEALAVIGRAVSNIDDFIGNETLLSYKDTIEAAISRLNGGEGGSMQEADSSGMADEAGEVQESEAGEQTDDGRPYIELSELISCISISGKVWYEYPSIYEMEAVYADRAEYYEQDNTYHYDSDENHVFWSEQSENGNPCLTFTQQTSGCVDISAEQGGYYEISSYYWTGDGIPSADITGLYDYMNLHGLTDCDELLTHLGMDVDRLKQGEVLYYGCEFGNIYVSVVWEDEYSIVYALNTQDDGAASGIDIRYQYPSGDGIGFITVGMRNIRTIANENL